MKNKYQEAIDTLDFNEDYRGDDFNYTPTYNYRVKVVNGDGTPIKDAIVEYKKNGSVIESRSTNSNGIANHKEITSTPPEIVCRVSAEGYVPTTTDIIVNGTTGSNYTTISLNPTTTEYYYVFYVEDEVGHAISDATVKVYESSFSSTEIDTVTTNSKGRAFYSNTSNVLLFSVDKNGYTYSSETIGLQNGRFSVNGSNTLPPSNDPDKIVIKLSTVQKSYYYYVISVKDDSGKPVQNVKVRLYSDLSYSSYYKNDVYHFRIGSSSYMVLEELFWGVREIISSVLEIEILSINVNDELIANLNIDSSQMNTILHSIGDKYHFTPEIVDYEGFCDADTGKQTVRDMITYIQGKASSQDIYVSVFSTNSDGIISILASRDALELPPNAIYAKGIELPLWYVWNNMKGKINAGTSQKTPSLNLTVNSYSTSTYYHNFIVIDDKIEHTVSNATVTYKDSNNQVLVEKTTDINGMVEFETNYKSVYVSVYKDGFDEFDTFCSEGSSDKKDYRGIRIYPLNSIRVLYEDTGNVNSESDDDEPVENIPVVIYTYDEQGKYVLLREYHTYVNGYIDTLETTFYTQAGTRYVGVNNVTTRLVPGSLNIYIPNNNNQIIEDNEFEEFNSLSINSIKKKIEKGNQELKMGSSERITYNSDDFRINIIDPDSITVYDIFTSVPVLMNNNKMSVIGAVDVKLKPDVNNLMIRVINRYSGYYNPIFKDVLFYNNFNDDCSFSNTSFDSGYEDNQGKFGYINNMWFHKVNEDKNIEIIKTLTPYYPLTGQYALDCRDYNIFESNWDMYHYTKQIDAEHSEPCTNISSMKDGLCMFGSKYLNVPNTIEICGFTIGEDVSWNGEWNDDWITNPDACPGEVMFKEVNDNSVDFYFFFKKRILRYFRDKLKNEFEEYISAYNPNYSFGLEGVDDDIDEYVKNNVLKLYRLDRVRTYIRRTKKGQHNSRIENDYTKFLEFIPNRETGEFDIPITTDNFSYFKKHGFVEINAVTMSKINRDDFDRKLVYNLRNGTEEEFAFSFVLKKI